MQREPEQEGHATKRAKSSGTQAANSEQADGAFRRGALKERERENESDRKNGQKAQEGNLRCVKLTKQEQQYRGQRKQL